MIKKGRKIAVSLLGILSTVCIAGGVSACKTKSNPMMAPDEATTIRIITPNDGSLPTAHTALENIGYMAYTLDNQAYYHAYAHNSTKAMGYEQITQTWKDYKSAALSGISDSVMICSDISYSTLSKSAIQTCSVGNREAYTRGGSKPGKNTTSTTAGWSGDAPAYYDKDAYYHKYGEFSTELCVYVINEYTIADASEVTVKEDGTYEQTYYLNEQAGCWYQYKMKTNGSLKKYPKFEHVQITFNFDSDWRVLNSYCEEKIEITPGALGGIPATSNSKTSTTFYYGEGEFDNVHYAYFDDYFRQYLGTRPGTGSTGEENEPSVMDILGNGFGKVMSSEGQQFNLNLTLGDTEYVGKIYAKLADMENILDTLDVRAALERKGSGQQDLYIQFKEGAVNVYYSDDFALNVNIGSIGTVIDQFKDWIKIFSAPQTVSAAGYSLVNDEEEADSGLGELLAQLKLDLTDDAAYISLATDNLMGTGIGANLNLDFSRTKDEDGSTFSFINAGLSSITYDSTSIKLAASVLPDDTSSAPISRDERSTAADLADYANSVYNMLNSDTLKVDLALNGNGEGVLSALEGANVALTAYLKLGNELSLKTDISAAFGEVSAKLTAYYGINLSNGGYGTVYLNLTEVNGKPMDGKIRCNIDEAVTAVKQLISSISDGQAQATAVAYAESDAEGLAQIINKALCLDFGKVFKDIYASNSQIRLGMDIDEVIAGLGIDVNGLKFGTAALALNNGEKASFNLNLPKLGFTASVSGSTEAVAQPDESNYLNAVEIVNLVNAAAGVAKDIIKNKDIAFDINATLIIDEIPLSVEGSGEVVWADGNIKVALDVILAVADGTSGAAKNDAVALKLLFDSAAKDDAPIAKFAVNSLGMEIYQSDLDETKAWLENIINSVKALLDGTKTGNANPEDAVALLNTAYDTQSSDNVADDIITILQSGNVQTILKTVLNFVSGLTSVDLNYNAAEEVSGLIISHAVNGKLILSTDGNLSLELEVNNDNGTRIFDGKASVAVGNGDAFTALEYEFANGDYTFTDAADAAKTFVKVAYDYLFAVIENMSIAEVLDGRTYTVQVNLDGAKSAIPALQNITVDANIYYAEGLDGDKIIKGKLAEIDAVLNINGVAVSLNARYNSGYIFIELRGIANYTFGDIKVKADAKDIYSVCEQVVDIITSKAVADLITGNANGSADSEEVAAMLSLAREGETKTSITGVLAKLFTLNFNEAFSYKKVSGVNTAIIQPDYILNYLGVAPGYDIGVITVGINPQSHTIEADITLGGNKWLYASAEAVKDGLGEDYTEGWQSNYIDIGFVSTLLSDIAKTAISGDKINTLYTLTGTIDIDISASVISIKIPVTNVKLTAGLDENGQFYVTLFGHLPAKSYLFNEVTKDMDISITYSGGYITLGRQVEKDKQKVNVYKVMTLEFFLDNMMDANNSPIRWLLGTSSTAWGLVSQAVSLNIDSGLTKPESLYLYEQTKKPVENKAFALGDILNGLSVKVDGKEGSYSNSDKAGDAAATKWKLTDNYYAFDINGEQLTGGTVSTLYAAILRDGENGITGLRAFAAVAGALEVDVKLDNLTTDRNAAANDYLQDLDVDFNHYNGATENTQTHTTSTFGCYSTETNTYESSEVLAPVTLTVVGLDGVVEDRTEELRYGSTVYLTNSFAPVWANEEHTLKIVFTDEAGNDLGSEIVLNDDILDANRNYTVKAVAVAAEQVNFSINLAGIGTVTGAFAHNEALIPYDREIKDYAFDGWYNDSGFTQKVETVEDITNFVNGVKTVYGKFINDEVTVNGVIYKLTSDGTYSITGYNADELNALGYTNEGSWLILENEIKNRPVTSIAAYEAGTVNALANANLKNVVVPENITFVGSLAFLDNINIKTVVFLADKVTFGGARGSNSSGGFPFYGCTEEKDGALTNLSVYYNEIVNSAGEDARDDEGIPLWAHVRAVSSSKHRYIGHNGGSQGSTLSGLNRYEYSINDGNRTTAGSRWAFVNYTFEGADLTQGITCLNDKVVTNAMSAEDIFAAISNELNGRTAPEYINEYTVTVSGGYTLDGKMHDITVTITENEADERWYRLDLTVTSEVNVIATGDVAVFDGATYARANSTVTLKPAIDGYKVALTSGNVEYAEDGDNITFTMPVSVFAVTAACTKNAVEEVTILSAVSYSYGGNTASLSGGLYRYTVTGVEEGKTELADPVSSGYTFIGYAYADGETLIFTSSVVSYSTLYAVWAVNREEVAYSAMHVTSGSAVPSNDFVSVDTTKAAGFAGWYTDMTFANQVTTLTTSATVLHARLQYNLNVTVNGSSCREVSIGSKKTSASGLGGKSLSVSDTFLIMEGETIYLKNTENNGKDYFIGRVDANGNKTDITEQINVKVQSGFSTKATEISATANGGATTLVTEADSHSYWYCPTVVTGDMNFVFTN